MITVKKGAGYKGVLESLPRWRSYLREGTRLVGPLPDLRIGTVSQIVPRKPFAHAL